MKCSCFIGTTFPSVELSAEAFQVEQKDKIKSNMLWDKQGYKLSISSLSKNILIIKGYMPSDHRRQKPHFLPWPTEFTVATLSRFQPPWPSANSQAFPPQGPGPDILPPGTLPACGRVHSLQTCLNIALYPIALF